MKPLGIVNARDSKRHALDQTQAGPAMRSTIYGWLRRLVLTRIAKRVVDFQTVETEESVSTYGTIVPVPAQFLKMLPEGQRLWDWRTLYTSPDFELTPDEVLVHEGVRFRVMSKNAYSQFGYIKYTLVNDYTQ
jgi:hypothetical protein